MRQGERGDGEEAAEGDGEQEERRRSDNIGKQCRLQLYCYTKHRSSFRPDSSISEVLYHSLSI